MKNITINLIEQNVLENVLSENFKHHNFKILSYKGFSEFITHHDKKKLSINVSNVDNYDLFVKNNISNPTLYLNSKKQKKDISSIETIDCPFRLKNFIEKVNVIYLKNKFLNNSKINIIDYEINLNSKVISKNDIKLKLTEKEVDFILFLNNTNSPQNINNILKKVWNYSNELETHTVETHVHRLRKKFLKYFNENNFIKINKNGYFI